MKKYEYKSQQALYEYLKNSDVLKIDREILESELPDLKKDEIYKGLSTLKNDEVIGKYKNGKYINRQIIKNNDLNVYEKYELLINKLDDKYKDITIHENPIHLAYRKRLTTQSAYIEFMLIDKTNDGDELLEEVSNYFSALINVSVEKIRKYNKSSIRDMKKIIIDLIDWNERPNLPKIIEAINDGYGDLFYLEHDKKNIHPDDSFVLSHMLYGKIGRKEYHDLLRQGADRIYVNII